MLFPNDTTEPAWITRPLPSCRGQRHARLLCVQWRQGLPVTVRGVRP